MTVRAMHVYPVNDRHEHDTDKPSTCPCHPVTELVDGGGMVVLHNAWDKRTLRETKASV